MNKINLNTFTKKIFTKLPLIFPLAYFLHINKKEFQNLTTLQKNNFFEKKKILYALKNDKNYENSQSKKQEFFQEINKNEFAEKYPNLHILNLKSVDILIGKMREKNLSMKDFRILSKRLVSLIMEETMALHYTEETIKESPLGLFKTKSNSFAYKDYVAISILRSGNAMVDEVVNLFPEISIGKVMIQRDEESKEK